MRRETTKKDPNHWNNITRDSGVSPHEIKNILDLALLTCMDMELELGSNEYSVIDALFHTLL